MLGGFLLLSCCDKADGPVRRTPEVTQAGSEGVPLPPRLPDLARHLPSTSHGSLHIQTRFTNLRSFRNFCSNRRLVNGSREKFMISL